MKGENMSVLLSDSEIKNIRDSGALLALLGVDEEIKTIVTELKGNGFEEPKGFSTLRGYIDDRIKELG
jgi:hypothetical protein